VGMAALVAGTGVPTVPVITAPGGGVAVLVDVGGKGVGVALAVRVGASVIVAGRVAVSVGVGDLGSAATITGGSAIAAITRQPSKQPRTLPAKSASRI
jgi:hypothetical protein